MFRSGRIFYFIFFLYSCKENALSACHFCSGIRAGRRPAVSCAALKKFPGNCRNKFFSAVISFRQYILRLKCANYLRKRAAPHGWSGTAFPKDAKCRFSAIFMHFSVTFSLPQCGEKIFARQFRNICVKFLLLLHTGNGIISSHWSGYLLRPHKRFPGRVHAHPALGMCSGYFRTPERDRRCRIDEICNSRRQAALWRY